MPPAFTRLIGIFPSDGRALALLGPVFTLVAAATVVTISFGRTLFLAHNPPEALPWMFIGAAAFTMVLTACYVSLTRDSGAESRLSWLLALAAASFVGLVVLARRDPAGLSLFIFAWSTGVGQLVVIQVWAWSGACIPTRQARRLFPVLSALATTGAVAGGLLTRTLVDRIGLVGLLLAAVVLLLGALLIVRWGTGRSLVPGEKPSPEVGDGHGALQRALNAATVLTKTPLLARMAGLVFLLQAASVLLDYQFSAVIQERFDQDPEGMAGFIGIYYSLANTTAFLLALVAAGTFTRLVGIGPSAACTAFVLALGSAVTALLGLFAAGAAFWSIATTSLAERTVSYAVSKQAIQAALMPLDQRLAESARFLIDGIVGRTAIVMVAGFLLLLEPGSGDYAALSPLIVVVALLAIWFGAHLAPAYRQALLQALRERRLSIASELPEWARSEASNLVARDLGSNDAREVEGGLLIARELKIPLPEDAILHLLDTAPPTLAAQAIYAAQEQGLRLDRDAIDRLLREDSPEEVICATLRALPSDEPESAPAVERLAAHSSPVVRAHAAAWRRSGTSRTVSGEPTARSPGPDKPGADQSTRSETESSARYSKLLDDIPSLMGSDDLRLRRLALDMLVSLALPEHVDMLFAALGNPRTRSLAMVAIPRLPADTVLQQLRVGLATDGNNAGNHTIRLLILAEHVGGWAAARLIEGRLSDELTSVRDQAVKSLWRMAARDESASPGRTLIRRHVRSEIERLACYAVLDGALATHTGRRQRLLGDEIRLVRARAERRLFRLLGLLYPREAVERAWFSYRSPDRRVRSNAIELVATTIHDPDLQVVVAYLESSSYQHGRSRNLGALPGLVRTLGVAAGTAGDQRATGTLLRRTDPWLGAIHAHAVAADRRDERSGDASMAEGFDDVIERLFLLRGVDIFNQVSADQLLPLAELAVRKSFAPGSVIFTTGDPGDQLYVVVSGNVIVERDGRVVATLGRGAAFGEMAVLDDAPRSATVRVADNAECLLVGRDEFGELLDIAPGLAKGIMRVLTMRLRKTLEQPVAS